MKTYSNSVVLKNDGIDPSTLKVDLNAGISKSITVRVASLPVPGLGATAAIFNINSGAIANPTSSNTKGNYEFKVTDGTYDVIIEEGTADEVIIASIEIIDLATPISVKPFDSLQLAVNSIDTTLIFDTAALNIAGRNTKSDGGGAMWDVYPSGTFTPSSYVVAHATLPLQLVLRINHTMSVKAYGVSTSESDNSTAIIDALNSGAQKLTGVKGEVYDYTTDILTTSVDIDLEDLELNGIDVEILFQGTLTDLGQLTAGGLKGTRDISFGSSAGVENQDLLIIHNQILNSFSKHRDYMDGEFNKIADINGTTLTMEAALQGVVNYPIAATTKIFKVNPISVNLKNCKFTTNGATAVYALRIKFAEGITINDCNVTSIGVISAALSLDKCYNIRINGGSYFHETNSSSTQYGIGFSNCQLATVDTINAYATRHPVSTGGDSADGAVPNRYINIRNSRLRNNPAFNIYAADFHGNTVDSYYTNCNVDRIGLAGERTGSIDNTVYCTGAAAIPIQFHELVGGRIKIHNNDVKLLPGFGFDKIIGHGASAISAEIDRDYHIDVIGLTTDVTSTVTQIMSIFSNAAADVNNSWTIDGLNILDPTDDSNLVEIIGATTTGTGLPPTEVSLINLNYDISANIDYIPPADIGSLSGTKITLPPSRAEATLTIANGGWFSTVGATAGTLLFNFPTYPIAPQADVSLNSTGKGVSPTIFPVVVQENTTQVQVSAQTAASTLTVAQTEVVVISVTVSMEGFVAP